MKWKLNGEAFALARSRLFTKVFHRGLRMKFKFFGNLFAISLKQRFLGRVSSHFAMKLESWKESLEGWKKNQEIPLILKVRSATSEKLKLDFLLFWSLRLRSLHNKNEPRILFRTFKSIITFHNSAFQVQGLEVSFSLSSLRELVCITIERGRFLLSIEK